MTVETLVRTEIEQAEDAAPDSSLAAAQFEAIIRAWKGEAVGVDVPVSPVGEADLDGSLALGQLGTDAFRMECSPAFSWMIDTWECTVESCITSFCTVLGSSCLPLCTW